MPYLSEEELLDYKVQIEEAEEQKRVTNYAHTKALRDEQEATKKFKIASIILGIIALLGIAGTTYFMFFNADNSMISKSEHTKQVASLNTKIAGLEETIKNLSMDQEINTDPSESQEGEPSLQDELVYTVQIGAYNDKDFSMYSDKFVNFKEIKGEDFNRYALGSFASLKEARGFRRKIVDLGLKNAFIASYQNGERVRIEKPW